MFQLPSHPAQPFPLSETLVKVLWTVQRHKQTQGTAWYISYEYRQLYLCQLTYIAKKPRSSTPAPNPLHFRPLLPTRNLSYHSGNRPTLNPLYSNISMHILHIVLHAIPKVFTRRILICPTIKSFFS